MFEFIFNYTNEYGKENEVTSLDMEEARIIWWEKNARCRVVVNNKTYNLDEDDFSNIYDYYCSIRKDHKTVEDLKNDDTYNKVECFMIGYLCNSEEVSNSKDIINWLIS